MEWFLLWCFCAVIAGAIASSKGRSGLGWFVLGLFIGPFALAVALLPSSESQAQEAARVHGQAGASAGIGGGSAPIDAGVTHGRMPTLPALSGSSRLRRGCRVPGRDSLQRRL